MDRATNPIDGLLQTLQSSSGGRMNAPEQFFDSIGMMRGGNAPVYRAVFGFAASSLAIFAVRPGFWFYPDGRPRPWSALSADEDGAVLLPWWSAAVACAFVAGTFI
jgi:hypothetical protein